MASDRSAWTGTLDDEARVSPPTVRLRAVADMSDDGRAEPFQGLTDGGNFWVKPLNNPQSPRVTVNEFLVGRLGRLIGAPVCDVVVVEIGADVVGTEFSPGRLLEPGMACGSRDVPDVNPLRRLAHRGDDDNRRRHAGVYALYDWCWGEDDQWLYDWSDQHKLYSHDHGDFLPGAGPAWTVDDLARSVDEPHELGVDTDGLDVAALRQHADQLEALTAEEIRGMLRSVPREWPVGQAELEALGWFLERRAPAVARRLRELVASPEGGTGL